MDRSDQVLDLTLVSGSMCRCNGATAAKVPWSFFEISQGVGDPPSNVNANVWDGFPNSLIRGA